MQVKEIIQTKIVFVTRRTTLRQLLGMFKSFHSFPVVPVVDDNKFLIGVVHLCNLFDIFQPHHQDVLMRNPLSMLNREATAIFDVDIEEGLGSLVIVADIMDRKIVKVQDDQTIKEAYDLMQLHGRGAIPVTDSDKKLVGIISVFDVLMQIFKKKGII